MSEADVADWFGSELSKHIINARPTSADVGTLRDALASGDEFVVAFDDNSLSSVVSLCFLSKKVSRKVLADLDKKA